MGFFSEFKTFAMRGNVMDMAIGIIIGGAFGKIVSSLVSDVIMPPIGLLLGGVDFSNLNIVMKKAVMEGSEIVAPAVTLNYGTFINTVIDFLIIAFAIFTAIRLINKLKKDEETIAEPAPAPEPSAEEKLLTEIRDLLKK
ncbi:MAG: large-conductance mechanosensitive channel protein MscL [Bacteroidales bacterium]|jgi:large conductance mechanosensitive channel|nr:large-conductance mechanosensitive channel protein MscL [Bacteroidales bacterium]MCK9448717.1 large-conductance mechanosensitive channel protein MscL [Bacteroidales bacterium]MDD3702075.1 large-conductance mechanosensitive channel protein MscL [Bacteroidales bacterium]MDY0369678.1 large-conductance mechanosensitive channel protein MscL [Bacteroidales bacterium]